MTASYIKVASGLYDQKFQPVPVHFDLRGKCAGMYEVKGSARRIRYNPWLFAKYWEDSLKNTVTHEVAHYLVDCIYGLRRVKPHGKEWKEIMIDFGARPKATGDYDLAGIPTRNYERFAYSCGAEPTISPVLDTSALSRLLIAASTVITLFNRCRQPGDEPVVCLYDPGH